MRARAITATLFALVLLGLGPAVPAVATGPVHAQDLNILLPADSAEYLLEHAPFELPDTLVGMRMAEDRTQRVDLFFEDGSTVLVQWAAAPEGGEEFNNNPRYEFAAYEIQKLFLDEPEYVVPPTALRMVPLDWYEEVDDDIEATFDAGESVLVVLQYFLYQVSDEFVWDEDRFEADTAYARNWGNANLLTYLIRHNDSNRGNLLISRNLSNPRVFAVDNGLSFASQDSNRGTRWRVLRVQRFPAHTVERLRALTEEDFHAALGVLAEFRAVDGELLPVEPGTNWDPRRGIRERDDGVQIGLTRDEIEDTWYRLGEFLSTVDRGRIETF